MGDGGSGDGLLPLGFWHHILPASFSCWTALGSTQFHSSPDLRRPQSKPCHMIASRVTKYCNLIGRELVTWFFSCSFVVHSFHCRSVSDIVLFVAYLSAQELAPSTISTYISALSYVHKSGSFSDPTKAFVVQKIKTAQSRLCSKPDIRLPITRFILHKLVLA